MRVNLKILAEDLGLSQTTVSRALNGYSDVSEETRQRVKQAAARYNYRPNSRATALATGRSMTVGHVIPVDVSHEVVNPIFGEFIAGASQTYARHGYEMLLTVVNNSDEEATYTNLAAKGAVDGLIVQAPARDDDRIAMLDQIGLPFVVHGRTSTSSHNYSWIDIDNRKAFYQATQLLLDLGHQRIALVNGREDRNFAWQRRIGYEAALSHADIKVDESLISSTELTEPDGHTATLDMLNQEHPPSAVLVSSYVMAIGVRRAITEVGLRMADDISVVIHDDQLSYFENDGDIPQFTATQSSVRVAGSRAAKMLIDIIETPSLAPITQVLDVRLTIGASTAAYNPNFKERLHRMN